MSRWGKQTRVRRIRMLTELGKGEMLKGDLDRMLKKLGYKGGRQTFNPSRFRPPVDNTVNTMQKWVQAALNVSLKVKLKLDGQIRGITRSAVKRFQRREGLTAHGYVDRETLQLLERRVGVRAPKSIDHEGLPHLLMLPRKTVWKKKKKTKGKPGETREMTADDPDDNDKSRAKKKRAKGLLQDEAIKAIRAIVFDDDFIEMAADALPAGDKKKLEREMLKWLDGMLKLKGDDVPAWLNKVRDKAFLEQFEATSIVRRQWWSEHIEAAQQ